MEAEQAPSASPTPEIPQETENVLSASSEIIAVTNANTCAYAAYGSKLLCASDTLLVCYNNDGSVEWQSAVQLSDPILKTAGRYILAAEKGSSKYYLFNGSKMLWENSSEDPILSADVSENGDVVIISDKANYKGTVTVVNRSGEVVFRWNSGRYDVIDADISPSARRLAVSLLNTETGADSKLSFFDISETESFATIDAADSIIFDIEFCGETLNAVADNKIIGANTDGEQTWTYDFGGQSLHRYQIEDSGYKLCVFDNSNVSEISILNARGSQRDRFESNAFPEYVNISDGYLLYNNDRKLYFSTLSGSNPRVYNCTRDIYDLMILDSDSLAVVYNSSIEFINF